MGDFKPTKPFWVYDRDRVIYLSVGWFSLGGDWTDIEPMIENPDTGAGVKSWRYVHGSDPWFVQKPKA